MTDTGNGNGKFAAMLDSVVAKFVSRYLMPMTGTIAMALAAFVLNQFREESIKTRDHIEVLTSISAEVRTSLAVIKSELGGQRDHVRELADRLRSDVDTNRALIGQRLDDHERRITQHDRQLDILNGRHMP